MKPLVALFATAFFVLIGSGLDLAVLNPFDAANHEGLVMAGWSYLSQEPTKRLAVGLGMLPCGKVGLIFLGLGTQSGVVGPSLEAAILLMVMGATFLAAVLLGLVLAAADAAAELAH